MTPFPDEFYEAVRSILWPVLATLAAFLLSAGVALADAPLAPVEAAMPAPRPETTESGHAAPVHPMRVLALANAMLNDGEAMWCGDRSVFALRGACRETPEVRRVVVEVGRQW